MLAQYLALQGATNLRRSMKRNVTAVDSPHVNQERTFHIQLLMEASASFSKNAFCFSLSFVLNFRPNVKKQKSVLREVFRKFCSEEQ